MAGRFFYIIVFFALIFPSRCFAETESGYKVIGLIVSLPSMAFVFVMVWLMIKNGDDRRVSIIILAIMLLSLIPLGMNFTEYGAMYPNWVAFVYGFDFQLFPDVLIAFLMVSVFLFQDLYRHKKN